MQGHTLSHDITTSRLFPDDLAHAVRDISRRLQHAPAHARERVRQLLDYAQQALAGAGAHPTSPASPRALAWSAVNTADRCLRRAAGAG